MPYSNSIVGNHDIELKRGVSSRLPTQLSGGQIDFILEDLLTTESFKTAKRQARCHSVAIARMFMEDHLPCWEMSPADQLVDGEATIKLGLRSGTALQLGAQVFCNPGPVYAIDYPTASKTGRLDLKNDHVDFQARWYNPRNGRFEGTTTNLRARNWISLTVATVENEERRIEG
ncbi:hypothetical protein CA13_61100 [Planctomycetes bacterium CA13]|uniref:Uncharacterized protein n=1 Tax=Novipirellula herctigrandis TaxID=2527986 RepID=A0A5C5ZBW6_9BACT|nr:hypothetical protein CA13_61100 [Planctomycetes bacterium CA13]